MVKTFTVGQIAKALRCHERSARIYLGEVNEQIDRYTENLAERIDVKTVAVLCRRYRDTLIGRRLVPLLQTI
ncbi:MAG: 5-carboxymethyl-2-hydroxymuconate Delta-isomerase [Chloroflexota bacterium]|nr:5-carboxymethyl-2-hydroxymuconate Delta-isomerase [Chloroflexota bacterium]